MSRLLLSFQTLIIEPSKQISSKQVVNAWPSSKYKSRDQLKAHQGADIQQSSIKRPAVPFSAPTSDLNFNKRNRENEVLTPGQLLEKGIYISTHIAIYIYMLSCLPDHLTFKNKVNYTTLRFITVAIRQNPCL